MPYKQDIEDYIFSLPKASYMEVIITTVIFRNFSRVLSRIQFLILLKFGTQLDDGVLKDILNRAGVRVYRNPKCSDDPIVSLHKSVFDLEQLWTTKPKI